MTLKKVILIVLGSVAIIAVSALLYITVVINPNDYKSDIVEQAKINSGGDLIIEGDISWRFFPNIGVTIGHTQIKNPPGFPEKPLLEFQNAQIDLAFMPLLNKKIEIGDISINGLSLFLHTREDGKNNLDAMSDSVEHQVKTEATKNSSDQDISTVINDLVIQSLQIVDAGLVIENLAENSKQSIEEINFSLGKLELGEAVTISFSSIIETGTITAKIDSEGSIKIAKDLKRYDLIALNTNISLNGDDLPNKKVDISNKISGYFDTAKQFVNFDSMSLSLLGMNIDGKFSADLKTIPNIKYDLKISDVDLDSILPKSEEVEEEGDASSTIDLSWMKDFNVDGSISIASVKVSNVTVSDISLPVKLKDAQLYLSPLSATLYEGDISSNIILDARKSVPSFSLAAKINNVESLPLVNDLMEKELVSGQLNMSVDLKGLGLDELSLRKNTQGNGQFAFTDGAIHGVNVAELIRSSYAKIKGQTIPESDEPLQTDFASFSGSFNMAKGIVENKDLTLLSPMLRISGKGKANLLDEILDYNLLTSVVGTLEGQGGSAITELNSISIPLKIKGPMADPSISLDMKELFKSKAKQKLKDKVKDKLKKLFGG